MPETIRFSENLLQTAPVDQKHLSLKNWRIVGLIFGFYSFLTVVFLPQIYFGSPTETDLIARLFPITQYILGHAIWFLVTLLVFWVSERLPFVQPLNLKNLGLHFLLAVFISTLFTAVYFSLLGIIDGVGLGHLQRISNNNFLIFRYITNSFVFYVGILAFAQAFIYYTLYKDREFQLQQAELQTLKTQLHPHFLFNTLNAISALVYVSPPDATKTISQLSDLLRLTLQNNKTQEVTLKEELDFLRTYIQLQQTLLQERLKVEWTIDLQTLDAFIPNMILQPLVENSIRHGIALREDGGTIEISSRRADDNLLIEVKDDGPPAPSNQPKNVNGIGLLNSAARLKHLYGTKQKFEISQPETGGWCVTLTIPFREQPVG